MTTLEKAIATYDAPTRERLIMDFACDFGRRLLDHEIDELELSGCEEGEYLVDELMQAARRRFYKPEYIACPGCGRTMYNLEAAFEEVKRRTSHLKGMVVAVMGCIVNGPGEAREADIGIAGGNGEGLVFKKGEPFKKVSEDMLFDVLKEEIEKINSEIAIAQRNYDLEKAAQLQYGTLPDLKRKLSEEEEKVKSQKIL